MSQNKYLSFYTVSKLRGICHVTLNLFQGPEYRCRNPAVRDPEQRDMFGMTIHNTTQASGYLPIRELIKIIVPSPNRIGISN